MSDTSLDADLDDAELYSESCEQRLPCEDDRVSWLKGATWYRDRHKAGASQGTAKSEEQKRLQKITPRLENPRTGSDD